MSDIKPTDIAIVGIACHFPDAKDYGQYWQNLVAKKNAIKEIPLDRWDVSQYYSADRENKDKSISKWCGLIDDIKNFDNEFFNISPFEAKNMDPQQRLLLQQSWRCIEDSAIPLADLQDLKTSVFVGAMTSDYLQTLNKNQNANNRYSILGNDHCILANRISHQFNFSGESISINAASASSLVAIHKAKSALVLGECDYAIAAGVNLNTDPFKYIVFSQAGMLSPDGQCKSFSDDANGYVPGDGVAAILLQPLSAAVKSNNHIYGVIKGSAINHIGSGKAITAPCVEAQSRVIQEALKNAKKDITDISYIEAHGSGTPLGDPVEIEAINRICRNTRSSITIGTVKPNIGHLEAASGIAGLIKALMVIKHQYIPANLNLNKINPILNLSESRLRLATGEKFDAAVHQCVGISSFGFGGVSCHLIVQKFDKRNHVTKQIKNTSKHFVLSAKSEASLEQNIRQWNYFLSIDSTKKLSINDICCSVTTGRQQFSYRAGFLVDSQADLIKQLKAYQPNKPIEKRLSFVFSDVSLCMLHGNEQLIRNHYQSMLEKVKNSYSYDNQDITRLFNNKKFHNTLTSVAIFESLQQLNVTPSLIETTTKSVWAAMLCSEIINLKDYLDVLLEHKNPLQLTYYRPKFPFKLVNILSPKYINSVFLTKFFKEVKNNHKAYKNIIEQAHALLDNNQVFKSMLAEWNRGIDYDLFAAIRNFQEYFKSNPKRTAYAIVAANVCLNDFYKKWMFECGTEQYSYYITVVSYLVCNGFLPQSDFHLICCNKHTNIDKCLSTLNSNHWQDINQNICSKQKREHREVISEKEQFITAINSIKNKLGPIEQNFNRIAIGDTSSLSSEVFQYKISTRLEWQKVVLNIWSSGQQIIWDKLYPDSQFNRLPLPCYIFDKTEFWTSEIKEISNNPKVIKKSKSKINNAIAETAEQIKTILAELLHVDIHQLEVEKSFDVYGLDSMAYTQLSEKINKIFNTDLTPASFYGFKNIQKLIEYVYAEQNNAPEVLGQSKSSNRIDKNNEDIAIVGFSGVMPKAETLEIFWNNLIKGIDGISEIPKLRWNWEDYYSTNIKDNNKSPSKWGGFMPNIEYFDAAFFGISPQEAKLMDPQQRLLLQTVWHALEHSGHKPSSLSGSKTGVFIGASTSDYEELVREHELAAHASTGMNRSIIASRISFLLDIKGPCEVIDTACSSSLVAIHKAIESIKSGHADMAIAGGVNALISPTHYISYGKSGMLSEDGHCKTFAKDANGYVRAEGIGVIVLKPLSQAQKDNDYIHAIIKASGVNHGGRANSLTAPNPLAQAALVVDTYQAASIKSHSIDYIENHGTGTPLGDPIEIDGLTQAFKQLSKKEEQTGNKCYLASVKSNIGHLEAAAGIAGVLKIILALKNQILPASQNIKEINPYIKLDDDRFEILRSNKPWPQTGEKQRRAGISSFGFGGVNAHLVIEEFSNQLSSQNTDENLIVVSAKSKPALIQYAKDYLRYINKDGLNISISNIAYTSQVGRDDYKFRLAVCAKNVKQLSTGLKDFIKDSVSNSYYYNVSQQNQQPPGFTDNENLQKLADKWSRGLTVDWNKLYETSVLFNPKGLQRIELPTYPFQKKRFWLGDSKKITSNKNTKVKAVKTNINAKITKESIIATEHIVNGTAISPGVYSLELIYSSLIEVGIDIKKVALKDVFWRQAISFDGHDVQLSIVNKSQKNRQLIEIKANEKVATQAVLISQDNIEPSFQVDIRPYAAINTDDLYQKFKGMGFDYGPSFRVINKILHHDGKYIAQLSIRKNISNTEKFNIDPRLMDGGLQACLACLQHHGISQCYIPIMVEKVTVLDTLTTTVFAYINPKKKISKKLNNNLDTYTFDIDIVNSNNQLLVKLTNVTFKQFVQNNQVKKAENTVIPNNTKLIKPAALLVKKEVTTEKKYNNNASVMSEKATENNPKSENNEVSTKVLLTKTIEYFQSIIAKTAALEINEVDTSQPFKEYGIDSFLTLSIIRNLEDDFGELRKTLLFEASNITELADIFINEQQETLTKLLGIKPKPQAEQIEKTESLNLATAFDDSKHTKPTIETSTIKSPELTVNNQYQTLFEHQLELGSTLEKTIQQLFAEYGGESIALSRKDIAPQIFICSNQNALFYFNINKKLLLAFRYVGHANHFEQALLELDHYCSVQQLQLNVLSEEKLENINQHNYSANAFGAVQRITNLAGFTIDGSRMRRLRYHINKFQKSGHSRTIEYMPATEGAKDDAIASMIEMWAQTKGAVNPYIWRVKEEMETGCMGDDYRVFLTYLDNSLQNVIIISKISSENSYLLDTEFYSEEMAPGAIESAICEIMQQLKAEGCDAFSLGLTFGSSFNEGYNTDPDVTKTLAKLAEDKIFEETGNYQFKNKFRCVNSPLYLYRPQAQPASNIIDLIMMIGNPQTTTSEQKPTTNKPNVAKTDKVNPKVKQKVKSKTVQKKQQQNNKINNRVYLEKAGFNPFNMSRHQIEFDLATDSWSELEYDFIKQRTQTLQALENQDEQQLESLITDIFSLPYVLPFASGRVAESFFCPAWPIRKKYVLQNVLFPTCLYHQINNDFMPIEVTNSEFYNRNSAHMFKGNMDCDLLKEKLKEYKGDIAFIWVELANNAAGGCPVSLANIKQIKACIGNIPLVLDATRIIENAYHIASHEAQYKGWNIWDIVKEICSYADAINASLTKDFGTHTGGFIATRDASLYAQIQDAVSTNGSGLSRTDHKLVCHALKDKAYILSMVKQRMEMVVLLAQTLIDHDITVIQPVGGHCILIDPLSTNILNDLDLPLPSFIAWLFENTGIRAGVHSVGRQRNTSMNNLIRIAIPMGIKQAQIQQIGQRLVTLFTRDNSIENLKLKNKPQGLFGDVKANYISQGAVKVKLSKDPVIDDSKNKKSTASVTQQSTVHKPQDKPVKNKPRLAEVSDEGIAVIGMGGRYPDANDLDQFWHNLSDGKNSIKSGPDWQARFVDKNTQQHMGGFVEDVDKFDSLFFSISPREAEKMDPQERLMLEVSWQALEDAGYYPDSISTEKGGHNVGVFIGAVWSYYEMLGAENRQQGGESVAHSQHWGISNRVSSFMNFNGPSLTVDTACSSSLTAIHLACESIRNGECKLALAGGVNLDLHPSKYHITEAAQFLSSDGLCRTFGKGGNGYVAGEGVGSLLLKPLSAAISDGDHIYGVIKSTVINHGGRTAGYTVPSPNAQADLISKALEKADINAETISYIEAHGTGTELGDPVEIQGISQAFRKDTTNKQYCSIGSVKTNIGHLEAAAGIAGATKLLLQMKHKQLVPSLHSSELNEYIDFKNSPFYVQQHKQFWQPLEINGNLTPRRAGLSSFGAGGTNVHIIFEEYEHSTNTIDDGSEQLIIVSAKKQHGLKQQAENLLNFLQAKPKTKLKDIAYTLQIGRLAMPKRLAIMASSCSQLIDSLENYLNDKTQKNVYLSDQGTKLSLDLFDGDESEQIIEILINNGSYNKIAKLWVNGININWLTRLKTSKAKKISLPTYPFAKESHWIEVSNQNAVVAHSLNNEASTGIHPLIDQNCSTFVQQQFNKKFNLSQFEFRDHIVDKLPTLPGVAYMEMARIAATEASAYQVTTLKNLIWASPINSLSPQDIKITLENKDGIASYEICTIDATGKKSIHSQGKAVCKPQLVGEPSIRKDIEAIKTRCHGFMTKQQCYDLLATRKLTYGDKLQAISGFHYGNKEGLTSLQLPAGLAQSFNDYVAHPSILDGAVQSIISLLEHANTPTQPGVPYVPFVLSEISILKPLTHKAYAHLTLDEGKKERDDIKKINIDILDETGQVLIQMKDFSFKAISVEDSTNKVVQPVSKQPIIESKTTERLLMGDNVVMYKPVWTQQKLLNKNNNLLSANCVVLFDNRADNKVVLEQAINNSSVQAVLVTPADSFTKLDKQHYQLNPNDRQHLQQLIETLMADDLTPDNFIHHLSEDQYLPEQSRIDKDLNHGLLSVFSLSQTLLKNRKIIASKTLKMSYVYHTSDGQNQPCYSAVNGFIRSIKQEGANINCNTININNSVDLTVTDWKNILAEQDGQADIEVMYDNNQRQVKQLQPITTSHASNELSLSKTGGVYLITGGAGGLGLIFAQELAQNSEIKLILTGRSELNQTIQTKLDKLTNAHVEYISCDLTDQQDVQTMVEQMTSKYGAINGIIHAAGVIKDGFLWNKEIEQFSQVLAPKIMGTQNLDNATKNLDLDYFILCSSIAATIGNMGQSDYAAANRFMDDFAQLRQQWCQHGLRKGKTLSINWPLWRSGGMQVNEQAEKWLLDTWGMKPLATSIGLEALKFGLRLNQPSFGIVEGNVEKIYKTLSLTQQDQKNITSLESQSNVVAMKLDNTKTQTTAVIQDNQPIKQKIKVDLTTMVIDLLKIKESDIDFADNMSTYGFDSVTFTEFTNLINNQLELDVTPLIFFEQETLNELTQYLMEDFSEPLRQHYASHIEPETIDRTEAAKVNTETVVPQSIEAEQIQEKLEQKIPEAQPSTNEQTKESSGNNNEEIAIIGVSGIMPQSKDVDSFWENLINKKNLISEIPKDRWDWKKFYGESDIGNSKTEIKWGGFMPEVDKFDAEFFNISPLEAELTDPQQRMFLETVWHTIEDSGYKASELSGTNTGVFVGVGSSDYHELLREQSNDFEAYSVAGWMHAVLANRISYFFNFSGASEPIGSACSSTLVAIDRAVRAIRTGQCDMCIAGGVSMLLNPAVHVGLGKASMLADDGRCKTFDHKANGYVRSEGIGALLLKPLSKAKADGDNIYAVIKGTAVNHGGHVNTFTTPNPKAQAEVLKMAFADADIDPATLTYIETHGTGTALGDPIEIQGLLKAFKSANSRLEMPEINEYCTLGSVKTNAGHLELASGMSGMLKLIFSLKNKTIPANINFEKVNPYIKLDNTPFRLADENQVWQRITDNNGHEIPRRAGISSFGFGGVNAHIIMEEYNAESVNESVQNKDSEQIITLSTKYPAGIKSYAQQLIQFVEGKSNSEDLPAFDTFAAGFQQGRDAMPKRMALVVKNYADLINKLQKYCQGSLLAGVFDNLSEGHNILKPEPADIEQYTIQRDLAALAKAWVNKAQIDWQQINPRTHKISLPNYPFQKNRYWLLDNEFTGAVIGDESQDIVNLSDIGIHLDLLPKQVEGRHQFKVLFDNSSFYIAEHKISGINLLPAASYLELINYAMLTIEGSRALTFQQVNWSGALTQESVTTGVILSLEKNNEGYDFSFYSKDIAGKIKHFCQGLVNLSDNNGQTTERIFDKNKLLKNSINQQQTYQLFAEHGFEYGTSLAIINRLNTESQTVYAELSLKDKQLDKHMLHTAILDAALQSILGVLLIKSPSDKIQVPVFVDSIKWYKPLSDISYVEVNEDNHSKSSNNTRMFNINVYDNNGALALKFLDLKITDLIIDNIIEIKDAKSNNTINNSNLRQATIDYLTQMIADETKRDQSTIEVGSGFDSFGIDSFLAMRMTKKLEKLVGPVVKTVFFEHSNLNSLTDYLLVEHKAALSKAFKIELENVVVKEVANAVVKNIVVEESNSNEQTLRVATIGFLTQMIADETKRDRNSIEVSSGFDSFGIDSFLAMRMTKKLEKLVGPVVKTVFFEHSNLNSLTDYLLVEHKAALTSALKLEPENVVVKEATNEVVKNIVVEESNSNEKALRIATIGFLTQMIADETKRDSNSIEVDNSFDSFGIDSFLAMRMTKKLEKLVGPVVKTVFFEHSNLNSLTDYLLVEHKAALTSALKLEPESVVVKEVVNKVVNNIAEKKSNSNEQELRIATIGFLTQMIADETKRDSSSIEVDNGFDSFGIDSFLAMRMTKKLEKLVGPVVKTVFFEHSNLNSLTDYLLKEHKQALFDNFSIEMMLESEKVKEKHIDIEQTTKDSYIIVKENDKSKDLGIQQLIDKLCERYGNENLALARNAIAPLIFIGSQRKAYFNFNQKDGVALAFTYVGAENDLEVLAVEFTQYCRKHNLQANMLTEKPLAQVKTELFSSNPFGMMQRMKEIENISLRGSKMRRLRYQISKFEQSGQCRFVEYTNGKDQLVDKSITAMIDKWASTKNMVNPYIWNVRELISKGELPHSHRIFLTITDKKLQNVIIITKLASDNGYLMDLEFYSKDMPLGGLEYSIWNILQTLSEENCEVFSLGATFGLSEGQEPSANLAVTNVLEGLQQQGAFDGKGNLQFKNKFRPTNTILYLTRPASDDPEKVVDVIMMIADPFVEDKVIESRAT